MILFPAIDLKEGQCVRLAQGDMDRATVFNDDPAEQAYLAMLAARLKLDAGLKTRIEQETAKALA